MEGKVPACNRKIFLWQEPVKTENLAEFATLMNFMEENDNEPLLTQSTLCNTFRICHSTFFNEVKPSYFGLLSSVLILNGVRRIGRRLRFRLQVKWEEAPNLMGPLGKATFSD
jgi:hypothetical protein